MQGLFLKVQITPDMIGKTCIIPMTEEVSEDIISIPWGEPAAGKFYPSIDTISKKQHGTYWACCSLVSKNYPGEDMRNWDTKEKVSENIKIQCRYIKSYFHYIRPDTKETVLQIITKSEGFDAPDEERRAYFQQAFPALADILGITEEELVAQAKAQMKTRRICKKCGGLAIHTHHYLEQSKTNIRLYGKKLLDNPLNTVDLCYDCHESKPIEHIDEAEFCRRLGIETRSKTGAL